MFKNISVVGGDLRQLTLARLLSEDGYNVLTFGFENSDIAGSVNNTDDLNKIFDADIIILPVPVSFDNVYLNTPFSDKKIKLDEFADKLNPISPVLGGRISKELGNRLDSRSVKYCDYMKRDELAIKNAVPTAEGAINIAISETPITIHNSNCLVLGYGKVGKLLARSLYGLGAITYVAARKYADLALIEGHGYHPLSMNEASNRIGQFDIIFNTVPALILNRDILSRVSEDALIIDLASKPGGVDFDAAAELNKRVIWALSLPGKVAPITAGHIIKDTITNIIHEMEV